MDYYKNRCSARFDGVPREWRKGGREGGREEGEDPESSLPRGGGDQKDQVADRRERSNFLPESRSGMATRSHILFYL